MIHDVKAQSIDKRQISKFELEQYIQEQANSLKLDDRGDCGFQQLANATENIISHARWLANQKTILDKFEYKQLIRSQGWKSKEEKRYLKVASAFEKFSPENLSLVEPATIFQLANNSKKYQPVLDHLTDLPEINQAVVRGLIEAQRKPKQPKQEKFTIWRLTPKGERYCQIPPIREESQQTGMILQQMMDTEGKTAQAIVAEAIELRRAYIAGELVAGELVAGELGTGELGTGELGTGELGTGELTLNNEKISVKEPEILSSEIPSAEILSNDNFSDNFSDNLTSDNMIVEEEIQTEDHRLPAENLSLETTEKNTIKNTIKNTEENTPIENLEEAFVEISTVELSTVELSPVEILIQTFKNAKHWEEIRDILQANSQVSKDHKQEAWDALTPLEKRRVMQMMPAEIQKLSKAKQSNKILDFREIENDVYQVKLVDSVSWEIVTKSELDNFLANL